MQFMKVIIMLVDLEAYNKCSKPFFRIIMEMLDYRKMNRGGRFGIKFYVGTEHVY